MKQLAFVLHFATRLSWLLRNRSLFGDRSARAKPRLLVDVSAIVRHDAQTGVQRVVRAVWTELQRGDGDGYQLVPVYATNKHGYSYAPPDFLDHRSVLTKPRPVTVSAGDKFLGLDLSAHFLPKYRSQVQAWRANGASIHLVVYDLLPILRPDWFNKATVSHFRKWFAVLANDADQAICISKQVSSDLRSHLRSLKRTTKLRIANMTLGGDISASRPSSGVSPDVQLLIDRLKSRAAILMVGTIEPRKGYDAAIAAFEHLWQSIGGEAPDFVIVGKAGWKTRALQSRIRNHPEHNHRLHWLEGVSDEGLCMLYDSCIGLCMASRGEGFGLPLVEAVSHRLHVLARDLPVFREQALPNVLYFEDDDPVKLGGRLMELAALGAKGRPPTPNLPSWSASVDALLHELGIVRADGAPATSSLRRAV